MAATKKTNPYEIPNPSQGVDFWCRSASCWLCVVDGLSFHEDINWYFRAFAVIAKGGPLADPGLSHMGSCI